MASLQKIKGRMESIDSTMQITNAMDLVATTKLNRSRSRVEDARPFFETVQTTIHSIMSHTRGISHPFIKSNDVEHSTYIVVASDMGLCGGYNSNVSKLALEHMKDKENVDIITIGSKARDFFEVRDIEVKRSIVGISESPTYIDAVEITDQIVSLFEQEKTGEVYFAYTGFVSVLEQNPKIIQLLPLQPEDFVSKQENQGGLMDYDPSPEAVLGYVIPKYMTSVIYGGMVESAASEQAARMNAMGAATDNAEDMIDGLSMEYNRARQAAITQELSEIVSGSEATG